MAAAPWRAPEAFDRRKVAIADRSICPQVSCIKMIDNKIYANDGDWVESLTALVEHQNGELEIINWAELGHDHLYQNDLTKVKTIA